MKTAHICFLWHMHQPYYTDPVAGSASMPWVRLHATKAYYDMAYVLENADGSPAAVHSIASGLDYPGVGPEHSYLREIGRAEYVAVTDQQALDALRLVSELEGIIPALETAHAFAWLEQLCPTLAPGSEVVINCSGRGDKDVNTVADALGKQAL